MSNLIDHAKRELELANLFDQDSDYSDKIAKDVLELINIFASQRHSGGSAYLVKELFTKLANFETLTPITSDPEEWIDRSDMSYRPTWQNKRDPQYMSHDNGKTWYNVHRTSLSLPKTIGEQ